MQNPEAAQIAKSILDEVEARFGKPFNETKQEPPKDAPVIHVPRIPGTVITDKGTEIPKSDSGCPRCGSQLQPGALAPGKPIAFCSQCGFTDFEPNKKTEANVSQNAE